MIDWWLDGRAIWMHRTAGFVNNPLLPEAAENHNFSLINKHYVLDQFDFCRNRDLIAEFSGLLRMVRILL
jgi:hypothetical protein